TNIVDIFTGGNLLVDRQLYLAVPKEMTVGAQELELVVQAATDEWLDSIGNPYDFEDPYRQLILTKNGFTGGNWGLTVNQALLVPDGPALNEARMMREQALARLDWSVHWMGVEL
ncbi:MAG: hypothetical protein GY946_21405, partial [bacterium]|nr:hypothetical protein [bacterium]